MLYFANPCGPAVVNAMTAGLIGLIETPLQGSAGAIAEAHAGGATWCADNGAFSAKFDEPSWWAFLEANTHRAATCAFAVAPDVVGNAAATLERSLPWLPKIRALGYPAAYVAQNGADHTTIPWDQLDVLFIGGTTECDEHGPTTEPIRRGHGSHLRFYCPTCHTEIFEWKLGPHPRELCREAKRHGKRIHVGRVNSERRFRYAAAPYPYGLGADSCDGTFLTRGSDKNLPQLLGWLRHNEQDALFAGGSS